MQSLQLERYIAEGRSSKWVNGPKDIRKLNVTFADLSRGVDGDWSEIYAKAFRDGRGGDVSKCMSIIEKMSSYGSESVGLVVGKIAMGINAYISGPSKSFVCSKNLTDVMSRLKTDFKMSNILLDRPVYFDLPETSLPEVEALADTFAENKNELSLRCILAHREVIGGVDKILFLFGWYNKNLKLLVPTVSEIPIEEDKTVYEVLNSYTGSIKNSILLKLACNLMMYVSGNSEVLNEELNKFSTKKSKREAEKQIYTSNPFCKIGFGEEFLRLIINENVTVSDHFRWQPYGKGRSQVKLILIKAHERVYKRPVLEEAFNEAHP